MATIGCAMVVSACSSDTPLGVDEEGTSDTKPVHSSSSTQNTPDAPELSSQPMEKFSVDKKLAEKLKKAGKNAQDQWYLDQLHDVGIKTPDRVLLSLRTTVCDEIEGETTIAEISANVLEPYDFSGKQQGAVISSSLFSECPNKTVMVPQGSTQKDDKGTREP